MLGFRVSSGYEVSILYFLGMEGCLVRSMETAIPHPHQIRYIDPNCSAGNHHLGCSLCGGLAGSKLICAPLRITGLLLRNLN